MSLIFCEGNTDDEATTRDISKDWELIKDSIQLVQWVSSVYKSSNVIGIWNLPGAVGILRDQLEELLLHRSQPLTLGSVLIT